MCPEARDTNWRRETVNKTKIEWVRNPDGSQGYSWNPITGCLNGCEYCYARKLANTRLKERYLANKNVAPYKDERDYMNNRHNPFYPRFWEDRMSCQFSYNRSRKPQGIFVCDMSDLFGIGIPENWTRSVINLIQAYPQHRFYLLTKQPQNIIKWSPFPDNCWVGVSATNPTMFYSAVYHLKDVQARVKYISFEPLLQGLRTDLQWEERLVHWLKTAGISWVILGSQTKPYKPPKIEWVDEIISACDKASISVFLKEPLASQYHI